MDDSVLPHFQSEFEGLCQILDLRHAIDLSKSLEPEDFPAMVPILACRSTKSIRLPAMQTDPSRLLDRIARFAGSQNHALSMVAVHGKLHIALAKKMYAS